MYHLYGLSKSIGGVLEGILMEGHTQQTVTDLVKLSGLPATIVMRQLESPESHLVGFIVRKDDGKPAPKKILVKERPFASERIWPYYPSGEFVKPIDGSSLEDALLKGYSYTEAKVLLNTCVPAVKRCTRHEFNEGVDLSIAPGIIEARADIYYFRTRYTVDMPARIDV